MTVSAAKLEANRRNAQKSTGPRTEAGKTKSKFNALDHGCRAKTLVLPQEDPQALADRHAAWSARFLPRDDSEAYFLEEAVVNSWMLDRVRRAQMAKLTGDILDDGVDRDKAVKLEVAELGRRLFKDRLGPLIFYPTAFHVIRSSETRGRSTSFVIKGEDSDPPGDLLICLQSTLIGCEWLLNEWTGLKRILERGQVWLSPDKLKAVRLLGKQPLDAIDDRDVAMVFMASFALKPSPDLTWDWEIGTEMATKDIERFRAHAAARELESLMPENPARAREALVELIDRAIERLTAIAEAYRERARLASALAADRLAFDDSAEGERLRRYELACGRAVSRSLDKMLRLGRGELPDPAQRLEALVTGNAPNEPTEPWENAPNEPTDGLTIAPAELTDALMIAPNEPTDTEKNAPNEPTEAGIVESDWLKEGRAQVAARRAEDLRRLNEQCRREAEAIRATRRARHSQRRPPKNAGPIANPSHRKLTTPGGPGESDQACASHAPNSSDAPANNGQLTTDQRV